MWSNLTTRVDPMLLALIGLAAAIVAVTVLPL